MRQGSFKVGQLIVFEEGNKNIFFSVNKPYLVVDIRTVGASVSCLEAAVQAAGGGASYIVIQPAFEEDVDQRPPKGKWTGRDGFWDDEVFAPMTRLVGHVDDYET